MEHLPEEIVVMVTVEQTEGAHTTTVVTVAMMEVLEMVVGRRLTKKLWNGSLPTSRKGRKTTIRMGLQSLR